MSKIAIDVAIKSVLLFELQEDLGSFFICAQIILQSLKIFSFASISFEVEQNGKSNNNIQSFGFTFELFIRVLTLHYGQVFKWGVQNWKDFCLKKSTNNIQGVLALCEFHYCGFSFILH
jgi:hypothetical protein